MANASLASAEHLSTARRDFLGGCVAPPDVFGGSPAGLRLSGTSIRAGRSADKAIAGVAEALQRDTDGLAASARRYEDLDHRSASLLDRGWDLIRPVPGGFILGGLSGIVRAEDADEGQEPGEAPEPGAEPAEEPVPSPGRSGEGPFWPGVNEASGDPRIEPWEKNWRGEAP